MENKNLKRGNTERRHRKGGNRENGNAKDESGKLIHKCMNEIHSKGDDSKEGQVEKIHKNKGRETQ